MKKRIFIGIFILLLSVSLVSAGLLTGAWGKYVDTKSSGNVVLNLVNWMTGKAVENVTGESNLTVIVSNNSTEVIGSFSTKSYAELSINGVYYKLFKGESLVEGDKIILLVDVGSAESILVSVGGVLDTIGVKNSKTINGVEIENVMTYYVFESSFISNITPTILNKPNIIEEIPNHRINYSIPTEEEICPLPAEYSKLGYNQLWRRLDVGTCNFFDADVCLESIDNEVAILKVDRWEDKITNGEKRRIGNIGMIAYLPTNETKPWNYITLTTWPCFEQVKKGNLTSTEVKEIQPQLIPGVARESCNGCLVNEKCLPYGIRMEGKYCDIKSSDLIFQSALDGECENSYECKSNECSNGKCISTAGLLQRLLDYLSKLFG